MGEEHLLSINSVNSSHEKELKAYIVAANDLEAPQKLQLFTVFYPSTSSVLIPQSPIATAAIPLCSSE